MSEFIQKIQEIVNVHFYSKEEISYSEYFKLMSDIQKLDCGLDLSEETISEIYKILNKDVKNQTITKSEIDTLINTIIPLFQEKEKNNNRGSIQYNQKERQFSFNNVENFVEKVRIPPEISENLTLDKISELKFLFQTSDRSHKKYVEFAKIKKVSKEMANTLRLSEKEIDIIFSALKDNNTNTISIESLSEFICSLEKDIFDCYQTDEPKISSNNKIPSKTELEIHDNDLADVENDDDFLIKDIKINDLKKEFVSSFLKVLDDAKIKNPHLTYFKKLVDELSSNLNLVEATYEKLFNDYQKNLSKQDLMETKMNILENDLKKQITINELLEDEGNKLAFENDELNKNNIEQSNLLEIKTNAIESFQQAIFDLQNENKRLLIDYKEMSEQKKLTDENYKIMIQKIIQDQNNISFEDDIKNNKVDYSDERKKCCQKVTSKFQISEEILNITISNLQKENQDFKSKYEELILNLQEYEQKIFTLQTEILKNKENLSFFQKNDNDMSEKRNVNRPSYFGRNTLISKNMLSQLKQTNENNRFSSIFNPRISAINKNNKAALDGGFGNENSVHNEENGNKKLFSNIKEDNKNEMQYKFLFFDEAKLFARDYLAIRENPLIIKLIKEFEREEDLMNLSCFSDYINRIPIVEEKKKRIVFITNANFYILSVHKFPKIYRKIKLENIKQVLISNKSAVLLGLKIDKELDDLIESFRRADLILYLMEVFKNRGLPMFERKFEKDFFNVKVKGKVLHIGNEPKILKNLYPEVQDSYNSAIKLGYLNIYNSSLFGDWQSFFFLLTDVGMISFKKEGDIKPINFIPILGSLIDEKPIVQDKENCFKIYYNESERQIILSTQSQAEKDDWLKCIHVLIKKKNIKEAQLQKNN